MRRSDAPIDAPLYSPCPAEVRGVPGRDAGDPGGADSTAVAGVQDFARRAGMRRLCWERVLVLALCASSAYLVGSGIWYGVQKLFTGGN